MLCFASLLDERIFEFIVAPVALHSLANAGLSDSAQKTATSMT